MKVAANSFLATKISYINAMAEVCEATGADVNAPGVGAQLRRPHRRPVPEAGPRLRRRMPAEGHPRLPCPRRRSSASVRRCRSSTRSTRSTSVAAPAPSTWSASWPAAIAQRRPGRGPGCGIQAELGRRARRARLSTLPACSTWRARIVIVYDPEANVNAHRVYPDLDYADIARRGGRPEPMWSLLLTEWDEFRVADPVDLGELVAAPPSRGRAPRPRRHPLPRRRLGVPSAGPSGAVAATVALAQDARDAVA